MPAVTTTADAAAGMGGWQGVPFASLRAGQVFPPRGFSIDAQALCRFRACLGETPEPGDTCIPAFLLNEFLTLKAALRLPPGVLHASETVTVLAPVHVGQPLRASVRIEETAIRNGKRFVVLAQEVWAEGAAEPALRITRTLFWPC